MHVEELWGTQKAPVNLLLAFGAARAEPMSHSLREKAWLNLQLFHLELWCLGQALAHCTLCWGERVCWCLGLSGDHT